MKGNALIHFLKYSLGIELPNTQTTIGEQELIKKYSKGRKNAVEIGVYEGFNTKVIAESICEKGKLFAIDPFFKGKLRVSYSKLIAINYTQKIKHKIVFIEKFSYNALNDVRDPIDFIFIDGDHSIEGFLKDWNDWFPKVIKGGIIALHDTQLPEHDKSVKNLGSFKVFQEVISKLNTIEIIEIKDSLTILKKLIE